MAGGYSHTPSGAQGLAKKLSGLQAQLDALRGAAGLTSAVVGAGGLTVNGGGSVSVQDGGLIETYNAATGSAIQLTAGQMLVWQDRVGRPNAYGLFACDPNSTNNYFRIFPPHDTGTGQETSLTLQGRVGTTPGNAWIYAEDTTTFTSGVRVAINAPRLELYSLPSVATATYGLGYNYNGTTWSVSLLTSSRKYKQDEEDAVIDGDAILAVVPKTFRSKAQVEENPDTTERHFGAMAEDLVALGLDYLVSFVEGEPEAVQYDRIGLALIPVVKKQAEKSAVQDAQIVELIAQNAALAARLDALEASNGK